MESRSIQIIHTFQENVIYHKPENYIKGMSISMCEFTDKWTERDRQTGIQSDSKMTGRLEI